MKKTIVLLFALSSLAVSAQKITTKEVQMTLKQQEMLLTVKNQSWLLHYVPMPEKLTDYYDNGVYLYSEFKGDTQTFNIMPDLELRVFSGASDSKMLFGDIHINNTKSYYRVVNNEVFGTRFRTMQDGKTEVEFLKGKKVVYDTKVK